MPTSRPSRYRRRLGAELKALRVARGYAIRTLAEEMRPTDYRRAATYPHARVQRIESGEHVPTDPELDEWFRLTQPADDLAARLRAQAASARVQTESWAELLEDAGGRHLNAIAAAREEAATINCSYQQFIVPGLAQTSAYSRALLGHLAVPVDPEAHLAGQHLRQEVLHEPGRRFRFVITRRVLRWNPDPERVSMAGQLDRLRELDRLENVDVRLLEDDAPPMGGYSSFTLYDGQTAEDEADDVGALVVVELEHHALTITEADDVDRYRRRFRELYDAATPIAEAS